MFFTYNAWGSSLKNKKAWFFKAVEETRIPTKPVKENADIFGNLIFQSFNNMIVTSIFQAALKLENITSVFKKASKNSIKNNRSLSILPDASKTY